MADIEFDEKSSGIITVVFKDENGSAVIPNEIKWTLTTSDGTVVNEREQVGISSPAASIEIVLSDDDLSILSAEQSSSIIICYQVKRYLTIEATYDSDAGSDLPLRGEQLIIVNNLKYIKT